MKDCTGRAFGTSCQAPECYKGICIQSRCELTTLFEGAGCKEKGVEGTCNYKSATQPQCVPKPTKPPKTTPPATVVTKKTVRVTRPVVVTAPLPSVCSVTVGPNTTNLPENTKCEDAFTGVGKCVAGTCQPVACLANEQPRRCAAAPCQSGLCMLGECLKSWLPQGSVCKTATGAAGACNSERTCAVVTVTKKPVSPSRPTAAPPTDFPADGLTKLVSANTGSDMVVINSDITLIGLASTFFLSSADNQIAFRLAMRSLVSGATIGPIDDTYVVMLPNQKAASAASKRAEVR